MSFEKVKSYFATLGMEDRCISFTEPTATVAEAAAVLGVEEGRIAKTMSFLLDGKPLIVVVAGDARVDNHKYKTVFHKKPSMIPGAKCEEFSSGDHTRRSMSVLSPGRDSGISGCVPHAV